MPSHYSIVRYVPDPIADERVNVGVVVFGEGRVLTRFVNRWSRTKTFGGEEVDFLREFAREIGEPQRNLLAFSQPWTDDTLSTVSRRWKNSIQLSEPRASLKDPDSLLAEVAATFLREQPVRHRRGRDKRAAVSLATQSVTSALRNRLSNADDLLKRRVPIEGKFGPHVFALVVGNGKPMFAAEGLSFEGPDSDALRNEVKALAWAIDDVRKASPRLPLGVVVLPPRRGVTETFKHAQRAIKGLRADFVLEQNIAKWAELQARRISGSK